MLNFNTIVYIANHCQNAFCIFVITKVTQWKTSHFEENIYILKFKSRCVFVLEIYIACLCDNYVIYVTVVLLKFEVQQTIILANNLLLPFVTKSKRWYWSSGATKCCLVCMKLSMIS